MVRSPISQKWKIILGIVSVMCLLLGYTLLAHYQHAQNEEDTTIPTWSQLKDGVVKAFEVNPRSGDRWVIEDAKATGKRFFLGVFFGVLFAVVIGVHMGCIAAIEAIFVPPLSLLAKIPPTAALAVFFVLAGTGTEMYLAMIAFGIMPNLAMTVYLSIKDFPEELLHKTYTIGASHMEVIWTIIFRYIFPKVVDAVRLSIGPAMVYLIAAEMVCGDIGFGYRIRLQSRLLNMNVVYPYLAILAGFGFAMDYGFRLLQSKCCPWYKEGEGR